VAIASTAWLLVSRTRPPEAERTPASATPSTRLAEESAAAPPTRAGRYDPPGSPAIAQAPDNRPPTTLAECETELSRLTDAVHECDRELKAQTTDRDFEQGRPVPFPPHLEAEFTREALVSAMTDAFKEAAVKGEVQVADCAEYPCIACGNLGDDVPQADINALIGDARRVGSTKPLTAYKDAAKKGDVFTYPVPGTSLERTLFCQAFYPQPADAGSAQEIAKRLNYRFDRLKDSLR
jgi:hypothetical protein